MPAASRARAQRTREPETPWRDSVEEVDGRQLEPAEAPPHAEPVVAESLAQLETFYPQNVHPPEDESPYFLGDAVAVS